MLKHTELPKEFDLEVTQEDIDLGKPGNRHQCPIARATERFLNQYPDYTLEGMGTSELGIFTRSDARRLVYADGREATDFVDEFDQLRYVKDKDRNLLNKEVVRPRTFHFKQVDYS